MALPASLPETGSLRETSLPQLLVDLHRHGFCGALALGRERVSKRFLLSEGAPVCSESSLPSEGLAAQLANGGTIGDGDRDRVAERTLRDGVPEARVLLELGLLDTRQLFDAMRQQLRLRLLECFAWPDGEFQLDTSESPPADAAALSVDLLPLVHDGIASHWSPERMLEDLAPRMSSYPRASDRLPQLVTGLNTDPEVSALLEGLDGSHTLWQALQAAPGPRALATAWLLDASDALRFTDAGSHGPQSPSAPEIELIVAGVGESLQPEAAQPEKTASPADGRRKRDAEALRREVSETHARLESLDYYQLLGLEPGDDGEAVKRAYLRSAKTYHPDVVARSGLEIETREQANRVFSVIGRAYSTLSDRQRRSNYDRSLGGDDSAIDAERLVNAETLFRKGEVLLRLGNFAGAHEFLGPAVDLWPEEADYQNALGWVLYKKLPSDPETAREHLERAVELNPQDAVALFRLSVVLRSLGDTEASQEMLRQAKQLDPELA